MSWLGRLSIACALTLVACAAQEVDDAASTEDAVTEVHNTPVRKQTIGNCWLYAVSGWIEALHKHATDDELQLSVSYLTYWSWFDVLTEVGSCPPSEISEGGGWERANALLLRYGLMRAKDFIREDADALSSPRQEEALDTMNAALKDPGSPLRRALDAKDRTGIRRALDAAFKLSPDVIATLDATFGADGSRTLQKTPAAKGSTIISPKDLLVASNSNAGVRSMPLTEILRGGAAEWVSASDGSSSSERRTFEQRVQRALHDGQPVLLAWWVDGNALDSSGNFKGETLKKRGISKDSGGHMSLISDYQVEAVPGFGTLPAGRVETRPAALEAALSPKAKVSFFRVKNSTWPKSWKGPTKDGPETGYHDLYRSYLYGSQHISVDASILEDAKEDASQTCGSSAPAKPKSLISIDLDPVLGVILPFGY